MPYSLSLSLSQTRKDSAGGEEEEERTVYISGEEEENSLCITVKY